MPDPIPPEHVIAGSDNVSITITGSKRELIVRYHPPPTQNPLNLFIALRTHREIGAAVLPFARHLEGSTLFLPFNADLLLSSEIRSDQIVSFLRRWKDWQWHPRGHADFQVTLEDAAFVFRIPRHLLGDADTLDFLIYAKDPTANHGWGWFWGCSDRTASAGFGDKYIPHYHQLTLTSDSISLVRPLSRHGSNTPRIRIYQLFVRLFGNINETRRQNGTLTENGVGRFADISDAAIRSLKGMGFTHVWLTGVLQQATATDYSQFRQPADDSDLLKGLAGSPYAIRDYFDVCPDYAQERPNRLLEFEQLIRRLHRHRLKAIIDLVANHVARSCDSRLRPDCSFGASDDRTKFFDPQNNFFYLQPDETGPPLRLPTWRDGQPISPTCRLPGVKCDGLFEGETTFGRVTGNNVVSWQPRLTDWYETVKLNYGFDFTDPLQAIREYPNAASPNKPIPDTWRKMDQIIAHWQSMGVDGFRCDMSHMVPPEFWSWAIAQARQRDPATVFIGEAYNDDPSKVPGSDPIVSGLNRGKGNVLFDLLNSGFDAVYDAPAYRALKRLYDGSGWANDIDREMTDAFICHNSVRYAENHDEVRLAASSEWGGIGMEVGRPVSAILFGMSRGTIMLYNGQEVGEPAQGAEGFAGDDARTSIFDYWSMPELVKWVNHHRYDGARLSHQQVALRDFYGRLIRLVGEPAFQDGALFPLNSTNHDNPQFGRLPDEATSGHWLYAFLRYDQSRAQRFLVIANLHPTITFADIRVILPIAAMDFLDLNPNALDESITLVDRLTPNPATRIASRIGEASTLGIHVRTLTPLTPYFLEFE